MNFQSLEYSKISYTFCTVISPPNFATQFSTLSLGGPLKYKNNKILNPLCPGGAKKAPLLGGASTYSQL